MNIRTKTIVHQKSPNDSVESCNLQTDSDEQFLPSNKVKDAVIIEYCPKVFKELRKFDEISTQCLEKSLNPIVNRENIMSIKESEGKSGSFFFFSDDQKFLIKTITSTELETILGDFIKNYYEHIKSNPESLLARIYGVYTIKIRGVNEIHIILMQNLQIFDKIVN